MTQGICNERKSWKKETEFRAGICCVRNHDEKKDEGDCIEIFAFLFSVRIMRIELGRTRRDRGDVLKEKTNHTSTWINAYTQWPEADTTSKATNRPSSSKPPGTNGLYVVLPYRYGGHKHP